MLGLGRGPRAHPPHAGSTSGVDYFSRGSAAHPRSRGEHRQSMALTAHKKGSSPLTRGALVPVVVQLVRKGLIPAHAGSTMEVGGRGKEARAHPRSRGEHKVALEHLKTYTGSSPLTRGARARIVREAPPDGLIPAHAGSTVGRP